MKNSKFIQILKTISLEEFKSFGKFIRSPYFNTNKTIVSLYNYLKKHYPVFSERSLDEKKIYKLLYPDKPFNSKRIRDISSEMLKLCENFLSDISFHKDKFYRDYFLIKELNPRNIQNIYKHYYFTLHKFSNSGLTGYESFNKRTLLDKEMLKFFNSYNLDYAKKILPVIINDTFSSSFFELLRSFSGTLNIIDYNNINSFISIIKVFDKIFIKNKFFNEPLLEIYYHISLINSGINDKSYHRIKKLFYTNIHSYKDEIKKEIYLSLINYLVVNKNIYSDLKVLNEYYSLMTEIMNLNFVNDNNNYLFPDFFFNYINMLLELNKINDASEFFENNKDKFDTPNKDDYLHFLKGKILFNQKKYAETLISLSKLTRKDKEIFFRAIAIKIVCNYELNIYLNVDKELNSFFKLAYRIKGKIPEKTFEGVYLFMVNFNKFLKISNNKSDLSRLKNHLITGDKFLRRQWLIQKIDESIKEL